MKTIILNLPINLLEHMRAYGACYGRLTVSAIIRKTVMESLTDGRAYPEFIGGTRTPTKKIALRLNEMELTRIDEAANQSGYNRTAWIIAQLERVFG